MLFPLLSAALLASLTAAVPTYPPPSPPPSPPKDYCKNPTWQTANFDDLTGIPGDEFNTIPDPYKDLYYQAFAFVDVLETTVLPGPLPHSGVNYAASNAVSELLQGSAEWTTDYPESQIKSYTLDSFYYACVLNLAQGATALNTPCNIAITGFAKGDNTAEAVQVASQEFSYNPSSATGTQQLAFGKFKPEFKNLEYVLIQYTLPGGTAALQSDLALLVDDVKYLTCQK